MNTKGIIKNYRKFNKNIKLATGINLTLYSTRRRGIKRDGATGVSTEAFGNKWFMLPKGRAIFKSFDSNYARELASVRMFNELLCKELCSQVGIKCAEYERARIGDIHGLVTYDISDGKKLISLGDFVEKYDKKCNPNLLNCGEIIDEYIYDGYDINKQKVMTDLYKIIVFDTLTMQTDRNAYNINFLLDEKTGKITVAPLIDNEFAFCGERISDMFIWPEEFAINSKNASFEDIKQVHSQKSKIFTFDQGYFIATEKYEENIEILCFYAKKHPALKNALIEILNKIDPRQAIEKLKNQGNTIGEEYQEYVCTIIDCAKEKIKQEKHKRVSKELINDIENIY